MTDNPTQTERILALLRERGRIGLTPKEALAEVGTMRLAARIADLRAAGHDITTETFTTPNGARVARYVLHERAAETLDDLLGRRMANTGETRPEAARAIAEYLKR